MDSISKDAKPLEERMIKAGQHFVMVMSSDGMGTCVKCSKCIAQDRLELGNTMDGRRRHDQPKET